MDTPEARDALIDVLIAGDHEIEEPRVLRSAVTALGDYKDASVVKVH